MAKEAFTASYSIVLKDDGILRVRPKEGVHIDLEDIKLYYEACERLTEGRPVPAIFYSTADYTISKKAQEYVSSMSQKRLATAVISNKPVNQFMLNTYLSMFKPAVPMRMFSNEEDAVAWLQQFMTTEK